MVTSAKHMPVAPLFVPASRPDRFVKAAESGTDAVILDLEDAVSPPDKDRARRNVVAHANSLSAAVFVRVNAAGTPWHEADLDAVRPLNISCIMLPKTQNPEDLARLAIRLGRDCPIVAIVENAVGLAHLSDILTAPGVLALAFGSVDFSLDVDCAHDRLALLAARTEIVWRSRAADRLPPLDGVTTDISSPEVVGDDARHSRKLGFAGKMAIHPKQVGPIQHAFRPNEKEVAWARRILEATQNGSATRVDDEMIDRPIVERARRLLTAHDLSIDQNDGRA